MFQLEFDVLHECGALNFDDEMLADWTEGLFACLDQSIEPFQENHLSISIEKCDDGARFFFDFRGIIINKELIESFLANDKKINFEIAQRELSEQELALEVFVPISG
jgi:stage 0 sporulation protein B (sporulation initiation phosphotransferase)